MLLLQPTLLLPVLIGCSLASFISPHYVSSYNGYYPVGPITDPEGSGTGSNDGTGANGGYAISPPPGTIFKVYRITPQGKVLVTNCNVCRLCCTGRNISVEIETIPNIPGNQNPGISGTPDAPRLPKLPVPQNPNPAGSDNQWSYPLPPQEGYRTAPYSPAPYQPGQQTSTPGTIPSPAGPGSNPQAPDSQSPSPAPVGPSPTDPIPSNPDTVPTPQFPQYPNYPYYPVAPGQYVTPPPPVTNPPCVPVITTTTTSTTTQAPTTTTTTTTPVPCTYTPPTITTPTPTVSTATSPPPSYVTPPTPGYPTVPSSTVPPVDSYLIPESTPAIETTTPGTEGPGGNGACCTIDLRSLQAIVSCGISVGAKGSAGQGCCTQSCSPGSIRQRPIQINPQFFSRYFQQLQSTRITCEQAVTIGLIKYTDIEGFCNQYVPWPTNPTGPPSGGETTVPPVWPTGEPGNYVIPPTQGSANLSVITSIVTIVIATVLCF
ncbi:hypothetical protein CRE_17929 [Caenorhabditis remanei]|uniref:Uncharacterized protein n=1 Tax=Caenorhabditis remanei TaxID=31234 RepID=E3MDL8_CAERE|nr:hypothetical protein CRE_17929 [Caenorhabditis remanei]